MIANFPTTMPKPKLISYGQTNSSFTEPINIFDGGGCGWGGVAGET